METTSLVILIIFAIVSFIHLLGEILLDTGKIKLIVMRYLTKPLLIPLLVLIFISYSWSINRISLVLVLALFFGFLGDILLMIPDPEKKRLWLKIGLVSFLLGHILYIVTFILSASWVWWSVFLAIPFVIAAALILPYLTKHTGDMTKAVIAYIIVIGLMGISSTFLFTQSGWNPIQLSALVIYLGSWFFAISDTLNGIGKFVIEFKFERVVTMFTYILGQFLIVLGFIIGMNWGL